MGEQRTKGFVIFVDAGTLVSFDQLATMLRRQKVPVIHLTSARNPMARLWTSMIYRRTLVFSDVTSLRARLGELDLTAALDIQCPEFLLDDLIEATSTLPLPEALRQRLQQRHDWGDKQWAHDELDAHAVPVPGMVHGGDATATQASEILGLPMMVKTRVGSGGEGVRRVTCLPPTVVDSAADLQPVHDPSVVYEQWLPGETLCYAAVARGGEPLLECCYRAVDAAPGRGASPHVQVLDDQEVLQIGRLALAAIDSDGLVNLDLVRDADGTPRVVDVNLRAWHSVVALHHAGLRFDLAWIHLLGLGPAPEGAGSARPVHLTVYPGVVGELIAQGRRARAAACLLAQSAVEVRHLGLRHVAGTLVLFSRDLLRPGRISR